MFGVHDWLLFMVAGFLLNIIPGPDSLLVMSRSAAQGWRAGSVASFGIAAGVLVHVLAAALGLSAILASSATAFMVVKYIGAAYLVYMGVMVLLQKPHNPHDAQLPSTVLHLSMKAIFWQGFLSNALNPKVALFFLAFVPQFIHQDSTEKTLAFIVLGLVFNLNSLLWSHFLAFSAAFASRHFKVKSSISQWLNKAIGTLFIGLGVKLALSGQS